MNNKYRYERIKSEIDGLIHISRYVKLKKIGVVYSGLCPFHNEKTPSLRVYPKGYINPYDRKKQEHTSFYCFGCGVGGDLIEFEKLRNQLESRTEALEKIEIEYGFKNDNSEAQHEYLVNEFRKLKHQYGNVLSLPEINLVCSSICRNYLLWVRENYPKKIDEEINAIEKIYKYFDNVFGNKAAIELMSFIDDVNDKINNRRKTLTNSE